MMGAPPLQLLDAILLCLAAWLLIGAAGIAALRNFAVVARLLFPLSAFLSVALAALALSALPGGSQVSVLPIVPFHLRLDALSSFFLVLIGLASAGISIYAGTYSSDRGGTSPGLMCL